MVMVANILLINGSHDHDWADTLKGAINTLATLKIAREEDVIKHISLSKYDLIILDAVAVKNMSLLIARINSQQPDIRIIVATSSPTWTRAREAYQAGAIDYMKKTLNKEEILYVVQEALIKKPLLRLSRQ